jgi:hypothetical protein
MPSLIIPKCPCCQKFMKTGDRWHCEWCWRRYHNGDRDGDWLPRAEFEKMHGRP